MRRTKEEAETTKQNLLAAGLQVFSRKGYQATRVEDIAKEANVTTGAIYHHFGGKSALYVALVEKSDAKTNRLAQQIIDEGGSPATILRRLLIRLFEFLEEDKEYQAVVELFLNKTEFSAELSFVSEQTRKGRRQLTQFLSNLIRAGVEAGDFHAEISPETTAIALVGFMNGMSLTWVQDPEYFSIKERAENLVDAFLFGGVLK